MAVQGKKFTITSLRKATVVNMLERQHSVATLAIAFGVTRKTMTKSLKAAKINPDAYRKNGMARLKQTMFERLESIDKDDKYVEMSLKVLDKYGHILDEDEDSSIGSTKKAKIDIAKSILDELS